MYSDNLNIKIIFTFNLKLDRLYRDGLTFLYIKIGFYEWTFPQKFKTTKTKKQMKNFV